MQPRPSNKTVEPRRDRSARVGRERQEVARFESLVGELSAAMARAPADEVDREIESWLGKISRALDLDRSAVYERDAPDQPVRATHTWVRPNFPPFPRNYDPEKLLQRSTELVMSGKTLVFAHPSEIPAENQEWRRLAAKYGPKVSLL